MTLTRAQARALDEHAVGVLGLPSAVLMENAARGASHVALALLDGAREGVVVLAGIGNNAGDGLALARHLAIAGVRTRIVLAARPDRVRGDASANLGACAALGIPIAGHDGSTQGAGGRVEPGVAAWLGDSPLVVDALLGTGLTRPIEGPMRDLIEATNRLAPGAVLALDLPSGMDADTGEVLGACVRASATVTFAAAKRAFLEMRSQAWLGEVHLAHIGIPPEVVRRFAERIPEGRSVRWADRPGEGEWPEAPRRHGVT